MLCLSPVRHNISSKFDYHTTTRVTCNIYWFGWSTKNTLLHYQTLLKIPYNFHIQIFITIAPAYDYSGQKNMDNLVAGAFRGASRQLENFLTIYLMHFSCLPFPGPIVLIWLKCFVSKGWIRFVLGDECPQPWAG